MKLKPIPKIPYLSRSALAAYLRNPGSPLILTTVMRDWPALRTWSFDFFARHFADFPVVAHAPQFPPTARWSVKTNLAAYIDYLRDPAGCPIAGEWLRGDAGSLRDSAMTLYAGNFNPAHAVHGKPALVFDHVPAMPDFIESWLDLLDPGFRERCERLQSHHFVYLSVAGGVTPLHHDFWDTHAFLAQVVGRKHAILFSPDHMECLYAEDTGDVRRMMDDPAFAGVEGWNCILQPGEMLIIPSRWLHYVETLEPSITYSADWIDGSNWQAYAAMGSKALDAREKRA